MPWLGSLSSFVPQMRQKQPMQMLFMQTSINVDVAHAADAGTIAHAVGTMTLVEAERMSAVWKS